MAVTQQQVIELYIATFNRAADKDGLDYWVHSGLSIEEIAQSFFDQPETQTRYPVNTTDTSFVTSIYNNLFGREPDAAGLSYWTHELEVGNIAKSNMILAITNGAQGDDRTIIDNQVTVGQLFADQGLNDVQVATSVIAGVTADHSTVTTGEGAIYSYSSSSDIFTLQRVVNTTVTSVAGVETVWGDADCVDCSITLAEFNSMVSSVTGINFAELGEANIDATAQLVNVTITPSTTDSTVATVTTTALTAAGEQFTSEAAIASEYVAFMEGLIYYTDPITGEQLSRFHSKDTTTETTSYDLTRVVLTTEQNNGATIEQGYTSAQDNLIVAGQTELIHGAYIDAGAGNNTLEIDMKGVYAQPLAILNVQTIKVENLENVYSSFYDLNATSNEIPAYYDAVTLSNASTAAEASLTAAELTLAAYIAGGGVDVTVLATLNAAVNAAAVTVSEAHTNENAQFSINPNSILDLTRAIDIENLVITEGYATDIGSLGTLTVLGIRNNATTTLEGSFNKSVNLQYSATHGNAINLVLDLGLVAPGAALSIAHNSATLNIDSIGGGNVLVDANLGNSTLIDLNISGSAELFISDTIAGAFASGHPANITTTNTAGVDLNMNGFNDEIIFTGTTDADDHFSADVAGKSVLIIDGNGNNEFSAQNAPIVSILSGNGNNEINTDRSDKVTITTGTGNDAITSNLSTNVTINSAGGNNVIDTDEAATVSITTGAGNDTITSLGSTIVTIDAGDGTNSVTVGSEIINVTTGAGNDTIVLSNATDNTQGLAADNDAMITIDAGTGTNTILLGTDYPVSINGAVAATLPGVTALEGSTITGENITINVKATSNLSQATLTGITSVLMENASVLTLTAAQVTTIGTANFTVDQDAFTDVAVLNILVTESMNLSDLGTLSDLPDSISLTLTVADGATLTMTAEELHTYIAVDGIFVDDVNGYVDNQVVITNASLTFDAFNQQNTGLLGGTLSDGAGGVSTNDVTIIREADGYSRPSEDLIDNTWTIDSDVTPVVDIAGTDIDASAVTTLKMVGAADLNFVDSVTLGNDFIVDFSAATGTVSGLTITNFEDINASDLADNAAVDGSVAWGSITGNGIAGTRINLELGDGTNVTETVGFNNNDTGGFKSTGVDTYVVTNINTTGNTATIWLCDQTDGVTTIGLQGNALDTITFGNVNWSTTILAQGDGFTDWSNLPKSLGNPDSSNVGHIVANYFTDGAQAIVNINNNGVTLGVTSTGTERGLKVAGLAINNADTITINVTDGDAIIDSLVGDSANSVVVTGTEDVTIFGTVDTLATNAGETLDSIDASAVVGTFTLDLSTAGAVNDLTATTLAGIDAIHYSSTTALALTVDQAILSAITTLDTVVSTLNLIDLGTQAVDLTALGANNIGTVTIVDSATTVVLDATTVLGNGINATDSLTIDATTSDTTVEMTEAQFNQIANAAPTIIDTLGVNAATGANFVATMRITDISTDSNVDMSNFDGTIEQVIVLDTTVATANTTITGAGITIEVANGASDLTLATLTAGDVDQVVFTADSTLTLTMAQINDIQTNFAALPGFVAGTSAFSIENGAVVTLNVTDLDGTAIDLGLIEDAGINIGTVTTTDADVALDANTTLGGADSIVVTSDTVDHTLALTAAQYNQLKDGTITEVDNDATAANKSNVLVTDLLASTTVVANAQGLDENVANIDFTNVVVTGTQVVDLAAAGATADVTMSATSLLAGFTVNLDDNGVLLNDLAGQTIRFNTALQAERTITVLDPDGAADNGTNVVWLFDAIAGTATAGVIDTTNYSSSIGRVWMLDNLVNGQNVEELFTTLNENIIIRIATIDDLLAVTNPFDRHVEVESFVQLPNGLTFSDVDAAAPFDFIENLVIDLGGATSIGNLAVDNIIAPSVNNDDEFLTLTINSILANNDNHYLLPEHFDTALNPLPSELLLAADQANNVGNISSGTATHVLSNVTINTSGSATLNAMASGLVDDGGTGVDESLILGTAINVGTITFLEDVDAGVAAGADNTATLLVNGTDDVTIASLNTDDAEITALVVTNTDAATLTITGASPAAAVSNTETLTVNSTDAGGSITFGTAGDADKPGVFGSELSAITANGAGDIDFGVIADIDGTIDATVSPNGFEFAGDATGNITFSLGGGATVGAPELGATEAMTFNFQNGANVAMTIANDFTVNAGGVLNIDQVDSLTIDGAVDLSVLTTDLNITNSAIVVGLGDTLTLTAEQADGLTITGAGIVNITALEDTLGADLDAIMTGTGDTGSVNVALDSTGDVILTAKLGVSDVTITGTGTVDATGATTMAAAVTPADRNAPATGADTSDDTTIAFTVEAGSTLNLAALQVGNATGVSTTSWKILADGAGTITVSDLATNPDADLSGLTATTVTAVTNTVSFTGDLGTAVTTVNNGQVMSAAYSVVTGKTINELATPAGTGTLVVDIPAADAAADLSTITSDMDATQITANITEDQVFTGNFDSHVVTVAALADLTVAADKVDGLTVTGLATSTITISDLATNLAVNLAAITVVGATATAAFTADGTFTGDLGTVTVTIADGVSMTASAAILVGADVNKSGAGANDGAVIATVSNADNNYDVDNADGDANTTTGTFEAVNLDLTTINNGNTGTIADITSITVLDNLTFVGTLAAATLVADGATLSTTATIANGKTINMVAAGTTGAVAVDATADAPTTLAGSANFAVSSLISALTATAVTGDLSVTTAADAAMSVAVGGTGSNTINADALLNGQILTVTGVDTSVTATTVNGDITAAGITDADADTTTGGATLSGGDGTNAITGSENDDIINGGIDADVLVGGAGADTFIIDATLDVVAGESITGGADIDTIKINTGNAVDLTLAAVASMEILDLSMQNSVVTILGSQLVQFSGANGLVNANGNDSLTIDTITGLTLGGTAADDTFVFTATDTNVILTAFTTGAGNDVLDFTALFGGAGVGGDTTTDLLVASDQQVGVDSQVYFNRTISIDAKDFGGADFADIFTTGAGTGLFDTAGYAAGGVQFAFIMTDNNDSADAQIYFVDTTLDGTATDISAADVVLVGTLENVDNATTFVDTNFA